MNVKSNIVAIVGMPGSGKSTAANFFKKKGIPILRFGDQTDIGLKELTKSLTEVNESWYRKKIRQELGMAAMAIKIEPRINAIKKNNALIVLDGLYSWEEYLYLIEKFSDLQLLCIYTRSEIRYGRLGRRQIRPLTIAEARQRDFHEIEDTNKGGPIAIADYLIKNEGSEVEFIQELEIYFKYYHAH